MRNPAARTFIALSTIFIFAVVALAPSASADVLKFNWAAQRLSPQFQYVGCPYKILYGKYGAGAAFAQLRVYPGCSGTFKITVLADQSNISCTMGDPQCPVQGAQDGCGTYYWMQVTVAVTRNTQVRGMHVTFPNGSVRIFLPNSGHPVTGRNC